MTIQNAVGISIAIRQSIAPEGKPTLEQEATIMSIAGALAQRIPHFSYSAFYFDCGCKDLARAATN